MDKHLRKFGKCVGLDLLSVVGRIFALANSILIFKMIKDRNNKGKVINIVDNHKQKAYIDY